jgi:hypothetical protein
MTMLDKFKETPVWQEITRLWDDYATPLLTQAEQFWDDHVAPLFTQAEQFLARLG